jgi:hypothetical protein
MNNRSDIDLKVCRVCKHFDWLHAKSYYYSCGSTHTIDTCRCPEYVPGENLEYLDYLYKKRSIDL